MSNIFNNDNSLGIGLPSLTPTAPSSPLPTFNYQEVNGLWFHNKEIVLDGWRFSNCRMDGCLLVLNSQFFEIHNCFIDKNTKIKYSNDTVNIIRLFNYIAGDGTSTSPVFFANKNPDGTVTIARNYGN
ncbi:hypothetical protein WCT79_19760 [Pectobacterium carotovorum]|uniref:hypothetical protein n=1 Tax=Pectobacterium carotovorum TaxID=554 RepID=UPI0030176030